MMNEVSNTANNHRSIRDFKNTPIANDLLEEIVTGAKQSSNYGNLHSWCVISTTDQKIKEQLYEAHYEQPKVLEAPNILTFCCDQNRNIEYLKKNANEKNFDDFLGFLLGVVDATIAAQTTALIAESYGLGICYMGTTLWACDKISKILELPQYVFPVTTLVIGYPNESPDKRIRLPLKSVLHKDKYQNFNSSKIEDIYKAYDKDGFDRIKDREEVRQMNITHFAQYVLSRYSKGLHQEMSEKILSEIKNKGFLF